MHDEKFEMLSKTMKQIYQNDIQFFATFVFLSLSVYDYYDCSIMGRGANQFIHKCKGAIQLLALLSEKCN